MNNGNSSEAYAIHDEITKLKEMMEEYIKDDRVERIREVCESYLGKRGGEKTKDELHELLKSICDIVGLEILSKIE